MPARPSAGLLVSALPDLNPQPFLYLDFFPPTTLLLGADEAT